MSTPPKKILVTGGRGLIGSFFTNAYQDAYKLNHLDITDPVNPVDLTNQSQVAHLVERTQPDAIVHFAAFTNVSAAWEDRGNTDGIAYQVNVLGTRYLAQAARGVGAHLVHLSTAYVFDGELDGLYTEDHPLNPIEWYGTTKAHAEEEVQQHAQDWTILRIDQPFASVPFARADIAHNIIEKLGNNTLPPLFTNHYMGPTSIDDLARTIDWALRSSARGIFHATAGEQWTDFAFAQAIAEIHNLEGTIKPGDLTAYLQTLERPYQKNTALAADKLHAQIDFAPRSVREALAEVRIG